MSERFPDIEVYIAKLDLERLNGWLDHVIDAAPLAPAGKHQWRTRGAHQGQVIPVLVMDKTADGFASLWFDSAHTPWENDQACAQAAAEALETEVRCSLGGWSPGDDPDAFWQVLPDGQQARIAWPDSGR
ncbi:hypothetical protein [Vreelandella sp. EE7]